MLKKILESGIFHLFIAFLFIASASWKTVMNNPNVINALWFCAFIFVVLSISRLRKSIKMKPKTRFTKLDEFYKAVNVLIEWLKKDGHLEDSQKLGTAMIAGATGSEILGDIMLALKSMKGNYSPELRNEINECFEFTLHHRKILGLNDGW